MNLDFSKILANAGVKKEAEIVHPLNELCECGHGLKQHEVEEDGQSGACTKIECRCINFFPQSEANKTPPVEAAPPTVSLTILPADIISVQAPDAYEEASAPSRDIMEVAPSEECAHLCKCGKWWSHGNRLVCRHPDILDLGLCQECAKKGLPAKPEPEDGFIDGKLTKDAIIKCYNQARETCATMSIEQLSHHILFNEKRIQEILAHNVQARRMRAEAEEDALKNIPDAERETVRQTLRTGKVKEKKEAKPKMSAMEKNIQSLMKNLGKTREEVEAFLND